MALVKLFLVASFVAVGSTYDVELSANILLKKDLLAKLMGRSRPSNIKFNIELPPNLERFFGSPRGNSMAYPPGIVRSGVNEAPAEDAETEQTTIEETTTEAPTEEAPTEEAPTEEAPTEEAPTIKATTEQATNKLISHDDDAPWSRSLQETPQLVKYLIKKSLDRHKAAAHEFKKLTTKNKDISVIVNATVANYLKRFEKHVNHLLEKNTSNQIEKDVILLDVVDTSNRLVHEGTLQVLRYIIDKGLFGDNNNVAAITNTLSQNSQKHKKEDFHHLCKKMNLCKPYPGLSDYLAEVLNEVIKLSDGNLHTLIMKTIRILRNKQPVTLTILGKHLVDVLDKYLQIIIDGDLTGMRYTLSILRDNIKERYTWKDIFDKVLVKRTKALRILLDMIDVAFDDGGAGIVDMHSSSMIKAIKNWSLGNTQDLETTVYSFFSYIADTVTNCWVGDTVFEVRALVQIILTGELNDLQKYQYLLSSGSNFVYKSTYNE